MTYNVAQKDDYEAEGLGYLRQGLKARPNVEKLLGAFLEHAQELEDALQALGDGLLVKNATGAVLDNYGAIVGVARDGQTDDAYKLFILAAIAANHGDATLQTTLQLAQKLFGTKAVFARHPLVLSGANGVSGAFLGFAVGSPTLAPSLWPVAAQLLAKNVGAAVSSEPLVSFEADGCFAFASARAGSVSASKGWGSIYDKKQGGPYGGLLLGT